MECDRIGVLEVALVAQWIEHWPPEPGVARSNRAERAIFVSRAGGKLRKLSVDFGYCRNKRSRVKVC